MIFAALNEIRARKLSRVNEFVRVAEHFAIDFVRVEKICVVRGTRRNHARRDFDFRLTAHVQAKFFVTVKPRRRDENFSENVKVNVAVKSGAARQPAENSRTVAADENLRNFIFAIMTVIVQNFDQFAEVVEQARRRELSRLQDVFDLFAPRDKFQVGKIFFAVSA